MIRRIAFFVLGFAVHSACAQTVVCFGDSLTSGYGAPPGSAYPDFLRQDLEAAGYRATVVNEGIAGDTAEHALQRLAPVLQARPSVVVLEFGANDAFENQPLPDIRRNLGLMLQAFERERIPVILAGIDARPYVGLGLPPKLATPYMQQFYSLDSQLAEQYGASLIPFLLQGVFEVPGLMNADGLHPTAVGYRKVAETVLPYVETVLKQKRRRGIRQGSDPVGANQPQPTLSPDRAGVGRAGTTQRQ